MSVKYRVRLSNERVVGPFDEQEVVELFEKDHIAGNELCQQFPIGEWKTLNQFPSIFQKITEIKNLREAKKKAQKDLETSRKKHGEETKVSEPPKDTPRHEKTSSEIKSFQEFKFQQGASVDVDYKELEKKHRTDQEEIEERLEKTRVLKRFKKNVVDVEKTVVLKRPLPEVEEEFVIPQKTPEEIQKEKLLAKMEKAEEERKAQIALVSEQTQFIDLQEVLPSMNAQLKASEVEFEQIAKIQESEEKHRLREEKEKLLVEQINSLKDDEVFVRDNKGTIVGRKKKVKGMSWIVAIAFLAIIYTLLFPDEEPKKIGPINLSIEFPAANPTENIPVAKDELLKGIALYNENIYAKRVLATTHYLASLRNKFNENQALGELILTYAELMENAPNKQAAVGELYKLIRVAEKEVFRDVNAATGAAIFYGKINKPNTGIITIKNFLRVGSKPNVKMLGVYLDLLISAGELKDARDVFEKVKAAPKKPIEVYLPLARFQETDDKIAEAQGFIEEGLKFYPNSVLLLLKEADYLLRAQSVQKYEEILNKVNNLNAERSPIFVADYLKFLGMQKALKGKNQDAAALFKKSLEIREDDELRMRLSELDVGGNAMSQHLILESKLISLIKRAKEEIKNKNWDQAAIVISEAVDADPNYIPAVLVLADLQLKRGLFDAAIHTLMNVKDKHPNNFQILSTLVKVYLKAYKFDEAQRLLVEGSQSKFSQTSDYFYLYGLFLEGKQSIKYAVKYFDRALQLNPVNDAIFYKLATVYFRNKQFNDAKRKLSEALFLDPKNPEYISLYAQILNEQDNADVAIGYLRDVISEMGEDPKLLSTITEIYFRSGQLKEFKAYYVKVQQLPKKDEAFYEYLITAAKLDDSIEEFEQYSKELLKINPGNLKVRMTLAEFYIEKNRLADATDQLIDIKEKLPSYPRVHYMLAKVYLAQGDISNAKIMAMNELKLNPGLDSAYYIMGEVYRQNREYRDAVANFEKAISKNSKGVDAIMALGWIKLNQNLASEALDLYTRAIRLDPNIPEVHKQLGFTYKALGQRAIAREKFEDYLKISPAAADKAQIEQIIRTLK